MAHAVWVLWTVSATMYVTEELYSGNQDCSGKQEMVLTWTAGECQEVTEEYRALWSGEVHPFAEYAYAGLLHTSSGLGGLAYCWATSQKRCDKALENAASGTNEEVAGKVECGHFLPRSVLGTCIGFTQSGISTRMVTSSSPDPIFVTTEAYTHGTSCDDGVGTPPHHKNTAQSGLCQKASTPELEFWAAEDWDPADTPFTGDMVQPREYGPNDDELEMTWCWATSKFLCEKHLLATNGGDFAYYYYPEGAAVYCGTDAIFVGDMSFAEDDGNDHTCKNDPVEKPGKSWAIHTRCSDAICNNGDKTTKDSRAGWLAVGAVLFLRV
jgi:hypothetical protein